jgi:uncharacterized membrane protein
MCVFEIAIEQSVFGKKPLLLTIVLRNITKNLRIMVLIKIIDPLGDRKRFE